MESMPIRFLLPNEIRGNLLTKAMEKYGNNSMIGIYKTYIESYNQISNNKLEIIAEVNLVADLLDWISSIVTSTSNINNNIITNANININNGDLFINDLINEYWINIVKNEKLLHETAMDLYEVKSECNIL